MRRHLPAGIVATAVIAFGLPQGLSAIREGLLHKAAALPFPKLLVAKGYCALALAPIAEVLLMKKVATAAVLLLGAFFGVRALTGDAEMPLTPALSPMDEDRQLPVAMAHEPQPSTQPSVGERRESAVLPKTASETTEKKAKAKAKPPGSLRITLVDHTGARVPDEVCLVTFSNRITARAETVVVRTDGAGIGDLQDLPPGYVRVQPLRGSVGAIRVRSGRVAELELALDLGIEVHGTVVDQLGNPVPHARIWLSKRHFSREGYTVKQADGAGVFRLRAVHKDSYVAAFAPGHGISYLQAPVGAPGESCKLRIVLDTVGSQVEIQVTDTAGEPVRGAEVVIGDLNHTPYRDLGAGASAPLPRPVADARTKRGA